MFSARRSLDLADSRGSIEDRTMAWYPLADDEITGMYSPPALEGSVTVSGSRFATERVDGIAPASEKMGTEEIAVVPGMTPRTAGGEEGGKWQQSTAHAVHYPPPPVARLGHLDHDLMPPVRWWLWAVAVLGPDLGRAACPDLGGAG